MQMKDRVYVEGTEPAIYIGHRVLRRKDGSTRTATKSWTAEYTLNSRQQSKSLGTPIKASAIRAAHALSRRLAGGTEAKPMKKVTLAELKTAYIEMLENRGRAPLTLVKYRQVLREFSEWWESHSGRNASSFTERDFWAYRNWLKIDSSDKTISGHLILVKQLFKWSAGKGKMIPINPIADATVQEPPPTPQPCFTPEQVEMLLAKAAPHQRPIFATMAYLGLRVGEVIALGDGRTFYSTGGDRLHSCSPRRIEWHDKGKTVAVDSNSP